MVRKKPSNQRQQQSQQQQQQPQSNQQRQPQAQSRQPPVEPSSQGGAIKKQKSNINTGTPKTVNPPLPPVATGAVQVQQPGPSQSPSPSTSETLEGNFSKLSLEATSGRSKSNGGNGDSTRGNIRGRRIMNADHLVVTRPATAEKKIGTLGEKVLLQANYFRITDTYDKGLNLYHIDFSPDLETKYRKQLISKHKQKFGGYIFDGTKLYTKLSFNDFEIADQTPSNEYVKITVRFISVVKISNPEWLQLYNIIVRRCMDGLKLQLIGRNLFNAMAKVEMKQFNLELWPGYVTSVRQHEQNILLCCDIIHKVMRYETLLKVIRQYMENQDRGDVKQLIKSDLLGSVVLTDYNNKTYRIDDIDFESNPKSFFETANGNITYVEYYRRRYNIKITDLVQPLLISKPLDKVFRGNKDEKPKLIKLIPELCRATGLTDSMKNNRSLMTALASKTRVDPTNRIDRLRTFHQSLYNTAESSTVLKEFNIGIDSNLVTIEGRKLPEPVIVFGNAQRLSTSDWDQCFKGGRVLQGNELSKWIVLIPSQQSVQDVRNFVKCCQDASRKMGILIREPEQIVLPHEAVAVYSKVLEQACLKDPQLIMIFISSSRADIYGCIKKKLTCDRAVPSQVVRMNTLRRQSGLMSIATKVCVQMNIKLRAAPWSVSMPDNIMCIGFDVCHSTKDRTKSYGALVASMDVNKKPGVYYSAISENDKGNEMSNDIALNVVKALRQYANEHQRLPSLIFFYRDGVGEGQLHQVYNHEIKHVNNIVEKIYKDKNIPYKMTYIVVSKRINTRIFTTENGRPNPRPGTIVDNVITLPNYYDFFLISQSVRQGTVSPTSYNIIYDSSKLSVDKIQDMTYRQTHMYYNYFATIRVPAVCQYAHKLAFLVGQYLHQQPNVLLEKSLYYL